jgi:hypothetical protein
MNDADRRVVTSAGPPVPVQRLHVDQVATARFIGMDNPKVTSSSSDGLASPFDAVDSQDLTLVSVA